VVMETRDSQAKRIEEMRRYVRGRVRPGYQFRYTTVGRDLEEDMSLPANRQRLGQCIRDEGWAADCKPDYGYILSTPVTAPVMATAAAAKAGRAAERSFEKIETLVDRHADELHTDARRRVEAERLRVSGARVALRSSIDQADANAREARKLAGRRLPPARIPFVSTP